MNPDDRKIVRIIGWVTLGFSGLIVAGHVFNQIYKTAIGDDKEGMSASAAIGFMVMALALLVLTRNRNG